MGTVFDPSELQPIIENLHKGRVLIASSLLIETFGSQVRLAYALHVIGRAPSVSAEAYSILLSKVGRLTGATPPEPLAPPPPNPVKPRRSRQVDRPKLPTLYHFTPRENLTSIARRGLLSLQLLEQQQIPYHASSSASSRRVDEHIDHDLYVHLCLNRNHPMATKALLQRQLDLEWIAIDPLITEVRTVKYSDTNAIAHRATVNTDPATALGGDRQAEVMIRGSVPPEYLTIPSQ